MSLALAQNTIWSAVQQVSAGVSLCTSRSFPTASWFLLVVCLTTSSVAPNIGRWWVIRSGRGPELLERETQGSDLQTELSFEKKCLATPTGCSVLGDLLFSNAHKIKYTVVHTWLSSAAAQWNSNQPGTLVCSLMGNSPASEFYMQTFRNTLSVPSS